ncbi:hypothetical protein [Kineosporia sp. NBRC 101731]|uniref:hypothetical protein n=1 Tax=Kineosporia sp. NBRC 101731 TaxID=3032199 RepID=UPI00249FF58A|nr:hypothetical protein [Kineosporia sp. NBRC 101731]GLY29522.1 hypothetical protein Kisp02_28870 [Kineosporia sp. NBRC 101731]
MPDTDVAQRARRRQNTVWLLFLGICVLLLPGILLATFLVVDEEDRDSLPPFLWILGGVQLLILLLVLGGLFWLRRRGVGWAQPPLSLGVDRKRRQSIFKNIRAVEPVPEADQEVADDLARRMVGQRWLVLLLPLVSLPFLARIIWGDRGSLDWFSLFAFIMMYASLPFVLRDARRARRWREQYGSSEA